MIRLSRRSELRKYGYFLAVDTSKIVRYLNEKAKFPEENNLYVRDEIDFHSIHGVEDIQEQVFGYGDMECGYCNGYNHLLNSLEYHACPEVDVAATDLILLLALPKDLKDGYLDTKKVKAFKIRKGEAFVLNPYVLHFSPCRLNEKGFRCGIFLADKTNMELEHKPKDPLLWMVNKWLITLPGTPQAKKGAAIRIQGDNIDVLC